MSYDIRLFIPRPGEDPLDTAQEDSADDDEGDLTLTPEVRLRNSRIVRDLQRINPALEAIEREHGVEINGSDDGAAMQIELVSGGGTVMLPYWEKNSESEFLATVSLYLKAICDVGGFMAYDQQTEELLTHENGFTISTEMHSHGVRVLRNATNVSPRPWWKFW